MRIQHTISSIDVSTGGPARSVTHLINKILLLNGKIEIELNALTSDNPIQKELPSKSQIKFHKNNVKFLDDFDLYHAHGIWQKPLHDMCKFARKIQKPYIITPRGMLEPWSLKQGELKKKLAMLLYQRGDLKKAACLHATAQMEVESIRNLGFKNPVAMIPNGINIENFPDTIPDKSNQPKKILFLSRIHIKKGIEHLIEAWSQIDLSIKDGWEIDIVGNGNQKYIDGLRERIKKLNLQESISIKPPVFGKNKIDLFRKASIFILPTYSENFGIVVAEALVSYTPVITTKGTPWEDLEKTNCGKWIDIGTKPLKIAIENLLSTDSDTLLQMGLNGRKLIENKYSTVSVAKKMIDLYEWILSDKEVPNFVNIYKDK